METQSSTLARSPHFFKIVLQKTRQDGVLVMPIKFVRYYGNDLSDSVVLKDSNRKEWQVKLARTDGKLCLQDGWQSFADYYSLEHGYLLVFRYEGNSRFHVLIFDGSAMEINYPFDSNCNRPDPNQKGDKLAKERQTCSIPLCQGKRKRPPSLSPCPDSHRMIRTRATSKNQNTLRTQPLASNPKGVSEMKHKSSNSNKDDSYIHGIFGGEESKDMPVARRDLSKIYGNKFKQLTFDEKHHVMQKVGAFESKNPFFVLAMQQSYISGQCRLVVPADFAKTYLTEKCCRIILKDSNGKTWITRYNYITKYFQAKICWKLFVQHNNLQIHDICVFELIKGRDIALKVNIIRAKEYKDHASADRNLSGKEEKSPVLCSRPDKKFYKEICELESSTRDTEGSDELRQRKPKVLSSKGKQKATENKVLASGSTKHLTDEEKQSFLERANAFGSDAAFVIAMQKSHITKPYHLSVPKNFSRRFFTKGRGSVILKTLNGKAWTCEYKRRRITRIRTYGWKKFVQENNLKISDVCVFELMKGSAITFKVSIFRVVDEPFNYPFPQGISKSLVWEEDASQQLSGMSPCSRVPVYINDTENPVPGHPHFRIVVIKEWHKRLVTVPRIFAGKYSKHSSLTVKLKVADKSWTVNLINNVKKYLSRFCGGWPAFSRDNDLQVGDICLFQLINEDDMVLETTIIRGKAEKLERVSSLCHNVKVEEDCVV